MFEGLINKEAKMGGVAKLLGGTAIGAGALIGAKAIFGGKSKDKSTENKTKTNKTLGVDIQGKGNNNAGRVNQFLNTGTLK